MTRLIMVAGIVVGVVLTYSGGSVGTDAMQEATKWLLAIALINASWGIRYGDMPKQDRSTARRVVTVGVLMKTVLIALVMTPVLLCAGLNPWMAVGIALMVAQIDPLSQTWLTKVKPGARAERILRVWATCDDPVTMAGLSVLAAVGALTLLDFGVSNISQNLASYAGGNIAVWLVSILMARTIRWNGWTAPVVLVGLVAVAGVGGWFLGAALGSAVIGQKMAHQGEDAFDQIAVWLDRLTKVVLAATAILTGMLVVAHWSLALAALGVILGLTAYGAQMVVAPILCKEESGEDPITRRDVKVMQLSHMNGVTALVIGLAIGQPLMASTAIVATWVAHGIMTSRLKA